jgi:6-phosphofructokinase 2
MKITTLTLNPALDINTSIDCLVPEIKLRCEKPTYNPGGGGINISRVLKRMKLNSDTWFPEGGYTGKIISRLLIKEELLICPFHTNKATRENINIVENKTKNQYRFCMPGDRLSNGFYKRLFNKIEQLETNGILVISGSMPSHYPENFFFKISNTCESKSIKLIVDTSGDGLKNTIANNVFLIKPNFQEMAELYGENKLSEKKAIDLSKSMVKKGRVKNILLTNGKFGAWWISKESVLFIKPPSVSVKSTIGAGDSTLAGAIYGIAQNYTHKNILAMSVAAGTATTLQEGSTLCIWADVEKIFLIISQENDVKKRNGNQIHE